MVRFGIGAAPKRREDLRFLTGQGRYLDDLAFDRLTHAVVLRSPHAHAEIGRIDTDAAKAMAGVLAVLTTADAGADELTPLRPYVEANTQTGRIEDLLQLINVLRGEMSIIDRDARSSSFLD